MRIIGNDPSVPRQTQEIASGTLPNGKPVVVNANGTVSTISGSAASFGAQQEFENAATENLSGTYDTTNDRIIFAYPDSGHSLNGKVVAGTVDSANNTISFGTPVRVNSAFTGISSISVDFDTSNGKLLIVFVGNSKIYAKVGTVSSSDNSISLGSLTEIDSGSINMGPGACKYDPDTGKFLIVYNIDGGDSEGVVATVSGTSVSFGTKNDFETSSSTYHHQIVYDTGSNKFVIAYNYNGSSLRSRVATISGTDVSFSNATTISNSNVSQHFGLAYDSTNNKIVAAFSDAGNSNYGTASIGTVGTTCTFTGETVFESATSQQIDAAFNPTTGAVDIAYKDNGNSQKGTFISATISSGSLTFTTAEAFTTGEANDFHLVHDPDAAKMIIGFRDHTTSQNGVAVIRIPNTLNLTSENYIGMSRGPAFQTGSAASVGSAAVFESASTGVTASTFDSSNNRIVISYRDSGNSNYATVVVGTVSGSAISFGTPTVIRSAAVNNEALITFDSNSNKVIAGYSHNALGKCKVLTVDPSDNSISVGSETTFDTQQGTYLDMTFDSTNNKVVVVYTGQNNYVETKVGTVSGTSISFGTAVVAMSLSPDQNTITFDSNRGKVVVCSRISTKGRAAVGTVSGTSISFASNVIFADNQTKYIAPTFDSNSNKVVIAYINGSSTDQGQVVVGDIDSSGVISFGSAVTYNAEIEEFQGIAFDSNLNKVVIAYDSKPTSKGQVITGTVSGTSITLDSETVFEAASVEGVSVAFDSNANKSVISYIDAGNSNYGTSVVFTPTTIATTRGQVADGGHALIDTQGAISDNQIGLTAGQSYFVQTDGTIGTTADDPSVFAGTAVSATKLIVKG